MVNGRGLVGLVPAQGFNTRINRTLERVALKQASIYEASAASNIQVNRPQHSTKQASTQQTELVGLSRIQQEAASYIA